jgi:hypothetical protein
MAEIVLVTEDDAFGAAAGALAGDGVALRRVNAEEAMIVGRRDRPDIFAVDVDSAPDAKSLIGAASLALTAIVVAIASDAWPGSDASGAWRRAGADAVLPKPSGPASPTLAGADRDAYAQWFAGLTADLQEGTLQEGTP